MTADDSPGRCAPARRKDVVVLQFGQRPVPPPLADLPIVAITAPADVDAAAEARRVLVLGDHAELATVLTRLLRLDRLDVEVGFVPRRRAARRARTGTARRLPLIRDDTGTVLAHAAFWLPAAEPGGTIHGEAVVDDTTLFDGEACGVRIEPTAQLPGLRASVLTRRMRPSRWVTGRAVQLGTTEALLIRDGVTAPRPVRRSTFYRHTRGWLAVR